MLIAFAEVLRKPPRGTGVVTAATIANSVATDLDTVDIIILRLLLIQLSTLMGFFTNNKTCTFFASVFISYIYKMFLKFTLVIVFQFI